MKLNEMNQTAMTILNLNLAPFRRFVHAFCCYTDVCVLCRYKRTRRHQRPAERRDSASDLLQHPNDYHHRR